MLSTTESRMLEFRSFSVLQSDKTVVRDMTLQIADEPLFFLVGSGRVGKSSFLRALAGSNEVDGLGWQGEVCINGRPLTELRANTVFVKQGVALDPGRSIREQLEQLWPEVSPARLVFWLTQNGVEHARSVLDEAASVLSDSQRRQLAVLARLQRDAALYLVDEPTAEMDDAGIAKVRQRLGDIACNSQLIVSTHNRQDCLSLGGYVALLSGGRVVESAPARKFFTEPTTPEGAVYVKTGGSQQTPPRTDEGVLGVWWLADGLCGGMSRPGMVSPALNQYRYLHDSGVELLVCLEERCRYSTKPLSSLGIRHLHLPTDDMAPLSFSNAERLCREAQPLIQQNRGVVLHCRGGLGRTGTGLAAILIWLGDTAEDAIQRVRSAKSLAIQSEAQLRFVHSFARYVNDGHFNQHPNREETSNVT